MSMEIHSILTSSPPFAVSSNLTTHQVASESARASFGLVMLELSRLLHRNNIAALILPERMNDTRYEYTNQRASFGISH